MKTRIEIPEPCNQDWNKMTILEKGRFCESCKKTVIDFTAQSKEEIIRELNSKKNVCGRIYASQLKEIHLPKRTTDFYLAKWAVLLGLGSILGITEPVIAKNTKPETELREKPEWKRVLPKKTQKDSVLFKGKVLDPNNKMPLAGVNIIFKGTTLKTQTDFDEEFQIKIPSNKLEEDNYLILTYIGYKTIEYKFNNKNKYININLNPDPDSEIYTEVILTGGIKRRSEND